MSIHKISTVLIVLTLLSGGLRNAYAQVAHIKNLVFEGAGIRGIAYAGVLAELESRHITDSVECVGGTSAGGITALTFALGYSAEEIASLISKTDFGRFNDGQYIFVGGIYRMKKKFGWYKTDAMLTWLENIIAAKTGNANITFSELHRQGFKDLYITGVSLNQQRQLIFSRKTYPHMRIKDAVRITMSVPLYFEAICIDSFGRVIEKPGQGTEYDLVVDGGLTGNFPIYLFDSISYPDGKALRIPNMNTIGVRIDTDEQIEADQGTGGLATFQINTLDDYISAFYAYVLENLNRQGLTAQDWQRTISVSSVGIGPKVKKLSAAQKQSLINSGTKSARHFISSQEITR